MDGSNNDYFKHHFIGEFVKLVLYASIHDEGEESAAVAGKLVRVDDTHYYLGDSIDNPQARLHVDDVMMVHIMDMDDAMDIAFEQEFDDDDGKIH